MLKLLCINFKQNKIKKKSNICHMFLFIGTENYTFYFYTLKINYFCESVVLKKDKFISSMNSTWPQ